MKAFKMLFFYIISVFCGPIQQHDQLVHNFRKRIEACQIGAINGHNIGMKYGSNCNIGTSNHNIGTSVFLSCVCGVLGGSIGILNGDPKQISDFCFHSNEFVDDVCRDIQRQTRKRKEMRTRKKIELKHKHSFALLDSLGNPLDIPKYIKRETE